MVVTMQLILKYIIIAKINKPDDDIYTYFETS